MYLLKCCSNRCCLKRQTLDRISLLRQRGIFNTDVAARNAFRNYQRGTTTDHSQCNIDLGVPLMDMPPVAPNLRPDTEVSFHTAPRTPHVHPRQDNNPGQKRQFPDQILDQVSTQHHDDQFGWQRLTNVPQSGRATSAPPPYSPLHTDSLRDNLDCENDVPNCHCIRDPTNITFCMKDIVEVPM